MGHGADFGQFTLTQRCFVLAPLAAGCSQQGDLPPGWMGALALDTGLRVRLVEVEASTPGYDGRPDEPWAREAQALLEASTIGRQVELWQGGPSTDPYERALVHMIVRDEACGQARTAGGRALARARSGRGRSAGMGGNHPGAMRGMGLS